MSAFLEALKLKFPEKYFLFVLKLCTKIVIDEWYFRLHYITTRRLLLLFTAIACVNQFIDKSILCDVSERENSLNFRKQFVETFCLIQTTFSIPAYINISHSKDNKYSIIKRVGMDGLLNQMSQEDWNSQINPSEIGESEPLHYAYYQWVPFFLLFQSISFYFPHYIWKYIENHKIRLLLQNIHTKDLAKPPVEQNEQIDLLGKYIWNSIDSGAHYLWTFAYIVCEFLNLILLLGSILLTNIFVKYQFTTYGLNVLLSLIEEDPERRTDPMSFVFPRITKCTFNYFGPSGTVQQADAICFLTMNLINEKIFVFLWFWFVLLTCITTLGLLFRFATICSARYRIYKFRTTLYEQIEPGDDDRNKFNRSINQLLQNLNGFDWILLRFIQLNVHERDFQRILARASFHRLASFPSRADTKLIC